MIKIALLLMAPFLLYANFAFVAKAVFSAPAYWDAVPLPMMIAGLTLWLALLIHASLKASPPRRRARPAR